MTRTVRRILLIVPSPGPQPSATTRAATLETGVVAEALRAAGFQAEICDATDSVGGTVTLGLNIELLRIAKEIVPGVFTVILGARPAQTPGKDDEPVDCVMSDHFERLPSLLTRLRSGQPLSIVEC